jgi:acyl carrier protein
MILSMLEIDDFRDDQHFVRDLRADSMLLTELAVRVERHFKVQVSEHEMREVRTLNDAVRVTARLLKLA